MAHEGPKQGRPQMGARPATPAGMRCSQEGCGGNLVEGKDKVGITVNECQDCGWRYDPRRLVAAKESVVPKAPSKLPGKWKRTARLGPGRPRSERTSLRRPKKLDTRRGIDAAIFELRTELKAAEERASSLNEMLVELERLRA